MIERGVKFTGRAGAIASLRKSHSQVEVILRVAGIVLNRSLEIFGCFFLAAAGGDNSEVVVYLGQRQAGGDELKGGFGFCEVSVSVGGETEVEICLASDCAGHWTRHRNRHRTLPRRKLL